LGKLTLGERLKNQGWQCGSALPVRLYPQIAQYLGPPHDPPHGVPAPGDWLVVISQSCDLVAPTLEHEPYVEVLWCRAIAKPRTQYFNIRSTRQLDFRPDRQAHPNLVLTTHAAKDRFIVPRSMLDGIRPHSNRRLADTAVRRIQAWLALRFSRPAWPDNFVSRIGAIRDTLTHILETVAEDDIAEVRMALSPRDQELPDSEHYSVAVFFVADEQIWKSRPTQREAIHSAFGRFATALKSCAGVNVDDQLSGVIDGGTFSWQMTQSTDIWNFANLTNRE